MLGSRVDAPTLMSPDHKPEVVAFALMMTWPPRPVVSPISMPPMYPPLGPSSSSPMTRSLPVLNEPSTLIVGNGLVVVPLMRETLFLKSTSASRSPVIFK